MAGCLLLRRTRVDLVVIGAFTADRWGDDQAKRCLIGPCAGFQTVIDRPELHRPFREIRPYLRALVGKHAVFYRVTPDGEVLIVPVLHAAMLPACTFRTKMRMRRRKNADNWLHGPD